MIEQLTALYEQGRISDAWRVYLEMPHKDSTAHAWGARIAMRLGQPHACRTAAELSLSDGAAGVDRAIALHLSGEANRMIGDCRMARERMLDCLKVLDDLPEMSDVLKGPTLNNLSLAYWAGGYPQEAIQRVTQAVAEFRLQHMDEYLRVALHNLAWYETETGEHTAAEVALAEAEPLCTTDDARWRQLTAWAFLHLRSGDLMQATAALETVLDAWDEGEPVAQDIAAWATAIGAEIGLAQGQTGTALQIAYAAYDLARKSEDHRACVYAMRVLSAAKRAQIKAGA